jgi:hypothetical protein
MVLEYQKAGVQRAKARVVRCSCAIYNKPADNARRRGSELRSNIGMIARAGVVVSGDVFRISQLHAAKLKRKSKR